MTKDGYNGTNKENFVMREELLKGLTEEQIAKIKACKNQEEILKIAKEEGIELSDEQLEAVSGGSCHDGAWCPFCYQHNTRFLDREGNVMIYMCDDCHKEFRASF